MRFRGKGKLSPKYIDPYEIMERVNKVVYRLMLSTSMNSIHVVFYVSSLHKYIGNPSYVLRTKEVQLLKELNMMRDEFKS